MADSARLLLALRARAGETLDDAERQELATALADPRLAGALAEDALWDARLHVVASAPSFIDGCRARLRVERDGSRFVRRVVTRVAPRRRARWPALLAASVLLVVGAGLWFTTAPPIVGSHADGVVRRGEVLRSTVRELRLHDGTTLTLTAGAQVTIASAQDARGAGGAKHLRLDVGALTVVAARQPSGQPLTITTPRSRTTVVGTTLTVDTGAEDRVTVRSGTVDVERRTDGATQRVAAGEELLVPAHGALALRPRVDDAPAAVAATSDKPMKALDVRYPAHAGVINVRDLGAKGDGVADDTAALQAAFDRVGQSKYRRGVVYLPDGTYRVSDQVWFSEWIYVQGQSRTGTVIRLSDRAAKFQDARAPRAVVMTSPPGEQSGPRNMNFGTFLLNLTIDTGADNPGANGVEFMSHNTGGLEDVTIRAGKGSGHIGIDMLRPVQGPALCRRVRVEGFATGLEIYPSVTASGFEDLELLDCRETGIGVTDHPASFRRLTITSHGPAITVRPKPNECGLFAIIDSRFALLGKDRSVPAIDASPVGRWGHNASFFLRAVTVDGYDVGIRRHDGTTVAPAALAGEWTPAKDVFMAFPTETTSLNLPSEETPAMPWDDPKSWADVMTFKPVELTAANRLPTDRDHLGRPLEGWDITEALQRAIDSGASTVSLKNPWPKFYLVRKPIVLRGKLRVLQGNGAILFADPAAAALKTKALLTLGDQGTPTVWLDRVDLWVPQGGNNLNPPDSERVWGVQHAGARTLVIQHSGITNLRDTSETTGKLFLEDVCAAPIRLTGKHPTWARMLDVEHQHEKVTLRRGTMWVLGYKSEGSAPDFLVGGDAALEVLGGVLYPGNVDRPKDRASFTVEEGGRLFATIARYWDRDWILDHTKGGQRKLVKVPSTGHRLAEVVVAK